MYVSHYALTARPFQLGAARRFFYPSRAHRAALHHLVRALDADSGLVLLTGEPGLGKTTLLDALASLVAGRRLDLVRVDVTEPSAPPAGRRDRRVLVLVDDAEEMADDDLVALATAEDGASPRHVVLAGPPSLAERLAAAGVEDRIVGAHEIGPLRADEASAYVEHRLGLAGWSGRPALARTAMAAVHRHTGGNPRAVNLLMGRVLLQAALDGKGTIDRPAVDRAAAEIASEDEPLRHPDTPPERRPPRTAGPVRPTGPATDRPGPAPPPGPDTGESAALELERLRRELHRLDLERLRQDTETSRRLVAALALRNERRAARRFSFLPRFARSF